MEVRLTITLQPFFDVDPKFVNAPDTIQGSVDMAGTDFSLKPDSPAINAGNPSHSAALDINLSLIHI